MAANMNDRRLRLVVAGAQLLYGEDRWQSPLARATQAGGTADGVSPATLQKIASPEDPRSVTDSITRKVAKTFQHEAARLRMTAAKVEKIASELMNTTEA